MKTTIELPVSLFRQTQALAERENKSLLQLVIEGLNYVTRTRENIADTERDARFPVVRPVSLATPIRFYEIEPDTGLPRLRERSVCVTQEIVDSIRAEEGI